jgi:hypothetical protein
VGSASGMQGSDGGSRSGGRHKCRGIVIGHGWSAVVVEDDNVMMSGAPFVEYDLARFNEMMRGPMDEVGEVVGTFVLGKSEESAVK